MNRQECLFREKTRMLLLKYLLLFSGAGLLGGAFAIVIYDIYRTLRIVASGSPDAAQAVQWNIRWRGAGRLALLSIAPLLLGLSIVVVPAGSAGRAGEPDFRYATGRAVSGRPLDHSALRKRNAL